MPAVSEKQRRFMAAEYGRAKSGQKTETGMSAAQLRDYVTEPVQKKSKVKRAPKPGRVFARLAGSPGVQGEK